MPIDLDRDGTVAVVTINAPATRNALGPELAADLNDILTRLGQDEEVTGLVVRGAQGWFCSGADRALLAAARERPADPQVMAALESIYDSFVKLASMPVPTVAAVRGGAVGAGLNLALAADLRIVAGEARLISGFLRAGLHPGGGHVHLLNRLVGPQTAAAMALFGIEVSGERAVELGLAWEAVGDALVEQRALELARRLSDRELLTAATRSFRQHAAAGDPPWGLLLRAEQAAQIWSMGRRRA